MPSRMPRERIRVSGRTRDGRLLLAVDHNYEQRFLAKIERMRDR